MIKIITQSNFNIVSIEHRSDHLVVFYSNEWYQEDIEYLYFQLFSSLKNWNIQERILGADRECFRFSWQDSYHFTLNFDYYSQSCWIEGVDDKSISQIMSLHGSLQATM